MEQILASIGLTTNYVPFYSSLEKFRQLPAAEASTAICKVFGDEFMKALAKNYGVPYSHTVMPIGARNTALWLRGIAALVGKEIEAEQYIAREHERIRPHIERIRKRLQGKRVFLCGGTGRSFAAAALIDDFGMKLIGMQTPTYDEAAQFDIEHLNGIHGDYVIDIANMQPFEQVNLVNRLKPDVFIGQPGWAARFGIPTTHVLDMKRPTMGYSGLVYLGDKIAAQIENPSFNVKLSRYARHPYKASWFESDPFKFITYDTPGSGVAGRGGSAAESGTLLREVVSTSV
jgi:nitrogenase molybdenum-iron protein alpha chain